jgi:hypothetical protein
MGLAAIPVVNIALVMRQALSGVFRTPEMAVAAAVSLAGIAALVWIASAIVQAEEVMVGSYRGTVLTFIRDRLRAGRQPGAQP